METGTQNKFSQEIMGNNVSKMIRDWRSPKQGFQVGVFVKQF